MVRTFAHMYSQPKWNAHQQSDADAGRNAFHDQLREAFKRIRESDGSLENFFDRIEREKNEAQKSKTA